MQPKKMFTDWDNSGYKKILEDAAAKLSTERRTERPLIQNVPSILKKGQEWYQPKMFSFGPIHRGKSQASEDLKLKLASHFIKLNNIQKPEYLLKKIAEKLNFLKSCYNQQVLKEPKSKSESESIKYLEGLAWMFFVDGCAIVHFIYCVVHNDDKVEDSQKGGEKYLQPLEIKNDQVAFAQHDIFLLENQLPYELLELVIDSVNRPNWQAYRDSIIVFVQMNLMIRSTNKSKGEPTAAMKGTNSQEVEIPIERSSCHLLDLLRLELIREAKNEEGFFMKVLKMSHKLSHKIFHGLRHKMWREKDEGFEDWQSFWSVTELQASGIWLKPCLGISLKNISFQGFCGVGVLKLPKLVMDDSTAPKLFNLIAYEMCPDFVNDFEVISYVCFIDSLIDEPGDVRELRKANILLNALGSDQEVADLFNKIASDLAFNPGIYQEVKKRLENYCSSKATTWMAQFYHDHFSSPWTVLAFSGALVALVLSFIQTFPSLQHFLKG